jgi:membrane-associated phospholipid phosphatase
VHAPLTFEALAIAFFAAIGIVAFFTRAPHRRRVRVALFSMACAMSVALVVLTLPVDVRLWLGHAYLATGYWIPALLVRRGPAEAGHYVRWGHVGRVLSDPPDRRFEAWLVRTDERCHRLIAAPPAWTMPLFELSYLLCNLLVPAAFIAVWLTGNPPAADHFWTVVLLAGFACYGSLPWLVSRPPRLAHVAPPRGIRRLNFYVLGRVSHGLNTFPSGHVAVSVAAALEVLSISRPAGAAFAVLATAIAVGAVAGRYHFGVDVVLGIAVGIATSALL